MATAEIKRKKRLLRAPNRSNQPISDINIIFSRFHHVSISIARSCLLAAIMPTGKTNHRKQKELVSKKKKEK